MVKILSLCRIKSRLLLDNGVIRKVEDEFPLEFLRPDTGWNLIRDLPLFAGEEQPKSSLWLTKDTIGVVIRDHCVPLEILQKYAHDRTLADCFIPIARSCDNRVRVLYTGEQRGETFLIEEAFLEEVKPPPCNLKKFLSKEKDDPRYRYILFLHLEQEMKQGRFYVSRSFRTVTGKPDGYLISRIDRKKLNVVILALYSESSERYHNSLFMDHEFLSSLKPIVPEELLTASNSLVREFAKKVLVEEDALYALKQEILQIFKRRKSVMRKSLDCFIYDIRQLKELYRYVPSLLPQKSEHRKTLKKGIKSLMKESDFVSKFDALLKEFETVSDQYEKLVKSLKEENTEKRRKK